MQELATLITSYPIYIILHWPLEHTICTIKLCIVHPFQTVEEYYQLEEQYVGRPPLNLSFADAVSPNCYDAMWTFAYALNSTIAGTAIVIGR